MADPIGALRVALSLDSAQFQTGLKHSQGAMAKFGKYAKVGMVAAAAAGATAIAGLAAGVRGFIDNADELSKSAQKIGIPTEELSRLKYAADLSGVSLKGLETSVGRLSRNMQDALEGTGEGAEAFARLGIEAANADGTLRPASDVLAEISEKFAAMPDGAEKTAAAMELMGRSGAEMIPLLNGGSDAIKNMMAEADVFGQVVTDSTGRAAEQFNDNMTRLAGAFRNIAADVGEKVLPTLVQFTDWLVNKGPEIATTTATIFNGVADTIAGIAGIVSAAVAGFKIASDEVRTTIDFYAALPEKVGQVMADIGASFTEAIAVLSDFPAQFKQIGIDVIAGLWAGIQERWRSMLDAFGGLVRLLPKFAKDILGISSPSKVFAEIGGYIIDGLRVGIESNADGVKGAIGDINSSLTTGFADSFKQVLDGTKSFADSMRDMLASIAADYGASLLQSGIGSLVGAIGIPTFAGGGYTGSGSRSGGVDGMGGFHALLHPNETVIDHTKGQSLGGAVLNYAPVIDARGADAGAVARLEAAMRRQAAEFDSKVVSAVRGGQARRML